MTLLGLLAGLALLIAGAELLVRGASRIAAAIGVSPLVIGLTVVAFGTSAPELAVSVKAALAGESGVALGNVIGSNTFNVLFILGLSAMIAPLAVSAQLIRFDVPVMIAVSALVMLLAWDGSVSRLDGAVLTLGIVLYTFVLLKWPAGDSQTAEGATTERAGGLALSAVLAVAGLALLIVGARLLVDNATAIAGALGVSDLVIGLTIVAAGTSMPEAVTSIVASLRGERDIAVGNVVGSNIFNLLGVLGVAAAVSPTGIPVPAEAMWFDLPIMTAVAVACLPIFFTGMRIERWEGAVLFAYYIAYTLYLVLATTGHPARELFGAAMLWFVAPLTAVTLAVLSVRAIRAAKRG